MRGVFSWNGVRSDAFGIDITEYPRDSRPKRKIDRYSVPGRNGDIILAQNAWENTERTYSIRIGDGDRHSAPGLAGEVAQWLCAPNGYCELWDDFDQGYYRMACFTGTFDVEALLMGRYGEAVISFDCKPQRYMVSGKTPIEIGSRKTIRNQTAYAARPLIRIERSAAGGGGVTIGGTEFTIDSIPAEGLYIDCEEMECYDGAGNRQNAIVKSSASEFATLEPGDNVIDFSGKVKKVTITPRWFRI